MPDKIRKSIVKSFKKNEYDLAALELTEAFRNRKIDKIIAALTEALEDAATEAIDVTASNIIDAILKDFNWGFANKGWDKKELVLSCHLWEEFWELPIDYNSFRWLQYEGEDFETWPAIDAAINELEAIIKQLRKDNDEWREQHKDWK